MKTIIFQSFRTENVSPWLDRCRETVRGWAAAIGADYEFIDDSLFDSVPGWYFETAKNSLTVVTDLARLVVARKYLAAGYERAVWVDADMVVFAPEHLLLPDDWPFVFCHEVWVHLDGGKTMVFTPKTNNALCAFSASDTQFLDHYIDACEIVIRGCEQPLQGAEVGTAWLTAMQRIMRFPVLRNIAALSPLLMQEIAHGGDRLTAHFVARAGGAMGAANLCASFNGRTTDGATLTDAVFDRVIDRLIATRGEVLNRWADFDTQIALARGHMAMGERKNAENLLRAISLNAPGRSEPLTLLAELAKEPSIVAEPPQAPPKSLSAITTKTPSRSAKR